MIKCYLAGAMEAYHGTNKAENWRKDVKEYFDKYSNDIKTIDPTKYYTYGKNYHKTDREVFRFDLHKVKTSDVVLINLNDIRQSIGSVIEAYVAYTSDIPVIGFLDNELPTDEIIKLIHPWIYCCVDRIETGANSMIKACNYIMEYYG